MKIDPKHDDLNFDGNKCISTVGDSKIKDHNSFNTIQQDETPKYNDDPHNFLEKLRNRIIGTLIIGHLNANSLRNKFEALKAAWQSNVDNFMVS